MVKLVDKQNIFNSGIISSKLYSRDDLKYYNNAIADALNFVCSRYGPLDKRTGTEFICDLGNPGETIFLLPFIFSIDQALLLEFREGEIRFYTFGTDDNGIFKFAPIEDPDDPTQQFKIGTPFSASQIEHISYTQALDVVYLAFADGQTPPYVLTRKDKYVWTLEEFETEDGPYLNQNYQMDRKVTINDYNTDISMVTLTNFTLTEADTGRWIRICTPRYNENTYAYEDKWSYGKITGVGDSAWVLNRTHVYTKTSTPTAGSTKAYKNNTATTQIGIISNVTTVNNVKKITVNGKTYSYVKKLSKKTIYEWYEDNISAIYVDNMVNGASVYSDSNHTTAIGTIVSRSTAYSNGGNSTDTTQREPKDNDKIYSSIKFTSDTKALGTISFVEKIGNVYHITATVNKQEKYYIASEVQEVTIDKKVKRRWVLVEETRNTDTQLLVQLNSATTGYPSTFTNIANEIQVTWSYRNFIDDSDKSWMTKPTSEWRLGVWHNGYGNEDYPATYPTKVTIHQQRLVWAGMTDRPWIWMSNSFAYKNYAYSDYEGEITDTNSIYYDISSSKISDIFWIASIKSLLIGTELGEIRLYSGGTALTPNDVVSNMESSYGSYNADPVLNDDNIVYIQRLQRTIRSLSYDYNQDAFVGPELTILAEGLTVGGVKKLAFQKEPNNTYWCLKEDGSLLSLTYDRAQDVMGWSQSKLAGEDVKVIDMAVLPSNVYRQDMLILCVERKINGVTKRYLELLTKNFNNDVSQAEACYLDCAKRIPPDDVPHKVITGLGYLEGQKVRVMDEGAYEGDYTVENGQITLATACNDVWVGLPYEAYLETLERDFQDKQLSTKMSKLRVYKLRMYIERSLGIEINRLDNGSESKLITFDPTKYMDTTPTLLTGKVDIPVPSAWDCDYRLRLKSEPGFPCTVAGFIIGVEVNEL